MHLGTAPGGRARVVSSVREVGGTDGLTVAGRRATPLSAGRRIPVDGERTRRPCRELDA